MIGGALNGRASAMARAGAGAAALATGLAAMPAQAATMTLLNYETYAYNSLTDRTSSAENSVPLTAGPTTLVTDFGRVQFTGQSLPGMRAHASADIGQLKVLSRVGGVMSSTGDPNRTDFRSTAYAGFKANVVFDTGTPGQTGTAVFKLNADGVVSNKQLSNASPQFANMLGSSSYIVRAKIGGGDCADIGNSCYGDFGSTAAFTQAVDRSFTYRLSYTSGVATQIQIELATDSFARAYSNGYVFNEADFSHTLAWGGLVSATAGGQDITATLQSGGGGFDFIAPLVTSVPEPAGWALLIGGFGMVGGTARRRRMAEAL